MLAQCRQKRLPLGSLIGTGGWRVFQKDTELGYKGKSYWRLAKDESRCLFCPLQLGRCDNCITNIKTLYCELLS
jgi:hypothetical protein